MLAGLGGCCTWSLSSVSTAAAPVSTQFKHVHCRRQMLPSLRLAWSLRLHARQQHMIPTGVPAGTPTTPCGNWYGPVKTHPPCKAACSADFASGSSTQHSSMAGQPVLHGTAHAHCLLHPAAQYRQNSLPAWYAALQLHCRKDVAHIWELSGGSDLAAQLTQGSHIFLTHRQVRTVTEAMAAAVPAAAATGSGFWSLYVHPSHHLLPLSGMLSRPCINWQP